MPTDFEQLLKELFGDSLNRLSQFSTEQKQRFQAKLQDFVREALKDDLMKLHTEIHELRERVTVLEAERARNASDGM